MVSPGEASAPFGMVSMGTKQPAVLSRPQWLHDPVLMIPFPLLPPYHPGLSEVFL